MKSKKEQKWEGIKSLFGADNYALVDSVTLCFHCIKLLIYIIFSVMSTMRNKCILVIDIANCYSTNFNIEVINYFNSHFSKYRLGFSTYFNILKYVFNIDNVC